jgi:tetratricopeptide (TPR) repeat protein
VILRLILALLLSAAICTKPDQKAQDARLNAAASKLSLARAEMKQGRFDTAIRMLTSATTDTTTDVNLYVTLAEAYRLSGNEAAAVLTLTQAQAVCGRDDPSLRRTRADLCLQMHQYACAIAEFSALRDAELLTPAEVLDLARLYARSGRIEEAMRTLEVVQVRDPDNAEAKTVEAETLLLRGDEYLAANLMDRLLNENPELFEARLLRARYFMSVGLYEIAEKDLSMVSRANESRPEVVSLKARVLTKLGRYEDAAALLEPQVQESRLDAGLLALLAEVRVNQKQYEEALKLVSQALVIRPKLARALYVRGRISEEQGRLRQAEADYVAATESDPRFAPALARMWPVYAKRDEKGNAIAALEKLFFMNEAGPDEKIALARFYADAGINLERGAKIVEEALKRDPQSTELKALRARLVKQARPENARKGGIEIWKPRR